MIHQTGVIPFKPEPARDDEDSKAEALKNPVRIVYLVCLHLAAQSQCVLRCNHDFIPS